MTINVLNIACDDLFQYADFLRADGRFGRAPFGVVLALPNLERLRARSYNFRRAAAVIPICFPSRAAIYTGMSPAETGIWSNNPLLSEYFRPEHLWSYELRQAGYRMESYGKILHLQSDEGYSPLPAEYYERMYHNTQASATFQISPTGTPDETYPGVQNGGKGWGTDKEAQLFDYQVASATIARLAALPAGKPFYMECGFKAPHEPFEWPQRLYEQVSLEDIIKPSDWPLSWNLLPFTWEDMGESNAGLLNDGFHDFGLNPGAWSAEQITRWKNSVRNYLIGILWLDEQLGRILDALDSSIYAYNTLVILWSDHGYHLGDKAKFHKFDLWEEACNAVFMVSLPGQRTGQDIFDPISLMDLGPTILDYCGLPQRLGRRGMSLRAYVEGNAPADRMVPSFWYGSISGAIGSRRITAYQDGSYEYVDLATDPWGQTNLAPAGGPQFEADRERLHQMSVDWGMQMVEEGATLIPGSPMAALIGYEPVVDGPVTSNFVVLGDLAEGRGDSPNYKRMYVLNRRDQSGKVVHMPEGVKELRNVMTVTDMTIFGNGLSNAIYIQQARKVGGTVTIHAGDGDDRIIGETRAIIVYGGSGNDYATGTGGGKFYGGPGNDTLEGTASGSWTDVRGGPGDDVITLGNGNDTVWAEAGRDTIWTGGGNDKVIVTGGSHDIGLGNGTDTAIVHRTGQPQRISGITGGVLDLSDWAGIGPVQLTASGADTIVTAGLERITLVSTTIPAATAAITGVSIAT